MSNRYPSKERRKKDAIKLESFCRENAIIKSETGKSYYFSMAGKKYRVSNHTIADSNRGAYGKNGKKRRRLYHDAEADSNLICINVSKPDKNIYRIYNSLKRGAVVDAYGEVLLT